MGEGRLILNKFKYKNKFNNNSICLEIVSKSFPQLYTNTMEVKLTTKTTTIASALELTTTTTSSGPAVRQHQQPTNCILPKLVSQLVVATMMTTTTIDR